MPDRYPIAVTTCPTCGAHHVACGMGCPRCRDRAKQATAPAARNDTGPSGSPARQYTGQGQNAGNGPKNESDLQAQAEAWLRHRGYLPRAPQHYGTTPPRGWYVHLHECRTNPSLPDLLLLRNDGRWLGLELKSATGRLRAGQADLLTPAGLCRTLPDLTAAVTAWENVATGN